MLLSKHSPPSAIQASSPAEYSSSSSMPMCWHFFLNPSLVIFHRTHRQHHSQDSSGCWSRQSRVRSPHQHGRCSSASLRRHRSHHYRSRMSPGQPHRQLPGQSKELLSTFWLSWNDKKSWIIRKPNLWFIQWVRVTVLPYFDLIEGQQLTENEFEDKSFISENIAGPINVQTGSRDNIYLFWFITGIMFSVQLWGNKIQINWKA